MKNDYRRPFLLFQETDDGGGKFINKWKQKLSTENTKNHWRERCGRPFSVCVACYLCRLHLVFSTETNETKNDLIYLNNTNILSSTNKKNGYTSVHTIKSLRDLDLKLFSITLLSFHTHILTHTSVFLCLRGKRIILSLLHIVDCIHVRMNINPDIYAHMYTYMSICSVI